MGSGASRGGQAGGNNHNPHQSGRRQGVRETVHSDPGRRANFTTLSRHFQDKPPSPPPAEGQLKITNVDTKLLKNRLAHHTHEYEVQNLIIRRGQSFSIEVTFNRPYAEDVDKIIMELTVGEPPYTISKGTLMKVANVEGTLSSDNWGYQITQKEGNSVTLDVLLPVSVYIGKYGLALETVSTHNEESMKFRQDLESPMYVLFNPWCKDDTVYMEGDLEKEEYVMNDTGFIWYGTYKQLGRRRWNFGQFDEDVFHAVMYLLESSMVMWARSNAVYVARTMSSMTNAPDDGGVLVGNWSGNYNGGTRPTVWGGSVAILEEYKRTKRPVKFGQCWVFSGVLTTILRCLGIPTRSVTNYASAHDTDGSLTTDSHRDEFGRKIDSMNADSVWNFHVWNDCWMARPDLPVGYGGWQAVDATPQERSEGIFWTGPSPLAAIKQGHTYIGYDTGFVFAEVNSDRIEWLCKIRDNYIEDMVPITIKQSAIGKNISTKSVLKDDREDITHLYKFKEGSEEERMAVKYAVEHGTRPNTYKVEDLSDDIEFEIETEDQVTVGEDFDVKILITNKSGEDRTLDIYTAAHVCYYTGVAVPNGRCKEKSFDLTLDRNEIQEVKMRVYCSEYLKKLVDQSGMKIYAMAKVKETGQMWSDQDDFRLRTPDLKLQIDGTLQVGKKFKLKVQLKNPIPLTLTSCTVNVEGPGLQKPKMLKEKNIVPAGDMSTVVELTPQKSGKRVVMATFDSLQLSSVTGSLNIEIAD
ncbi:protein-glutamine gamma-glutamyltransferase K-like [Ptychodera flava]|uniref:protein-glutamine gamma-glutamyltransferase K-like n=1 Tax=Ptychodera flava TaxID=63121 RepID=UPI00396A9A03